MRELFSRNNEIILEMFMKQGSTKMPGWKGGNEGWGEGSWWDAKGGELG